MRTIQDLYPLKLYSNKQRVYIPFNVVNKKKGSAILLLGTSIEDSIRMINHPAVYNPNIYRHYYMDRSIVPLVDGTGIKPEEFDEVHEAALSEAIAHIKDSSKMKINIIGANSIERNYIKRDFNEDSVRRHFHNLRIRKLPAEINIVVCSAKEAKVKGKMAGRNGKVYEISQNSHIDLDTNTIYLMNLYEYKDAGEPDGKYEVYVASNLTELACQIGYPDAPTLLIDYISMALSGFCTQIEEDILKGKKERRYISEKGWTVAWGVYRMLQDEGYSGMVDLLNGEGYTDLAKYTTSQSIRQFRADIYGQYSEATLTAEQRKNMKSSDYGLPDQKKYPMPDEAHVRAAIRFFNHADEKDEKKLAAAIKRKIRDYGMTVKVGENNRFAKYYHEGGVEYKEYVHAPSFIITEHKLVSKIDNDWMPKGHKDLNKYKTIPLKGLTGDTFYAKKLPILKHINPDHDVTIWMNGSDPVAVGACRDDTDPDIKWLTALEVADNYKGYGLGPQVLEYMTKVKGCNALSVFRKNEVAKAMYEKYGYRESEPSKAGIKAGQQKVHFMYYGQKVIKKMNKPTSPDIKHEGSFMRSDFGDILTICSHLETAEFKRISFTETYQDSPFVAKRIIKREGYTPAGFMELYHFPSRPGEAQIVTAVDPRFRGKGLAKSMLAEMLTYVKESRTDIDRLIWTVHPGNVASSTIAEAAGFSRMDGYDCHGRMVYEKYMTPQTDANPITEAVIYDSNGIIQEIGGMPFVMMEADDRESKIFSTNIRRYLTRERMRTNSRVTSIYAQIKAACPQVKKTYLKLPQYKSENCFVDLFYYHQVFLQHMIYKMDKGVRFYFEFLNRLLHNPDVDNMYQSKTVFFPVPNLQGKNLDEYMDYKKGINFFSMLNRLVRSAPQDVISAWGDMTFVFLGTTGYFKINFKDFSIRTMVRVKKNLSKLAYNQPVIPAEEDAEMPESPKEADKIDKEDIQMTANHTKAATIAMAADEIESRTGVKIDNLAGDGRDVKQSMCTGEPFTMYDQGFHYDDYWTNEKMKGTAIITVGEVPKGSSLERILKNSVKNKYKL